MQDVAIVGVGLHPFGRFGDKPALEMGADAIDLALADSGLEWQDIQVAFGGSSVVASPDSVTGLIGLTGIPFTRVGNACATSASAILLISTTSSATSRCPRSMRSSAHSDFPIPLSPDTRVRSPGRRPILGADACSSDATQPAGCRFDPYAHR